MMNEIYNLFPLSVMVCKDNYDFSKKEMSFIKKLKTQKNKGQGGNARSVSTDILNDKIFKKLKKFILERINIYTHEHMKFVDDVELYITQSWINYNDKTEFHHKHHHPNSIISGVLYIQGDAPINFHMDKSIFPLTFKCKEYTVHNAQTYWLGVETGKLFLFPSTLEHSVSRNEFDKTRISLSFNTFAKGNIGTAEELTSLQLGGK